MSPANVDVVLFLENNSHRMIVTATSHGVILGVYGVINFVVGDFVVLACSLWFLDHRPLALV